MTIDWIHFSPQQALLGGAMIGLASGLLIMLLGRVAGISGIIGGLLRPVAKEWHWRFAFVLGLLMAAKVYGWFAVLPQAHIEANYWQLIVAGLLVGFGTRYGSGCTSGHGVCGIARLSWRSIVATLVFLSSGFATVYFVKHWIGA